MNNLLDKRFLLKFCPKPNIFKSIKWHFIGPEYGENYYDKYMLMEYKKNDKGEFVGGYPAIGTTENFVFDTINDAIRELQNIFIKELLDKKN